MDCCRGSGDDVQRSGRDVHRGGANRAPHRHTDRARHHHHRREPHFRQRVRDLRAAARPARGESPLQGHRERGRLARAEHGRRPTVHARHDRSRQVLHQYAVAHQPGQDGVCAVPADARGGRRSATAGDAATTAEGPGSGSSALRCAHVLARATPYAVTGPAAGRLAPPHHRRDRLEELYDRPNRTAVGVSGAGHSRRELRPVAEHRVPDHRTDAALRRLHGGHGAPLLSHVAAVRLQRRGRDAVRPRWLPERSLPLRRHRAQ
jgi:hypothetical protein